MNRPSLAETHERMAEKLRAAGWTVEPPKIPKYPDQRTSRTTECAYTECLNEVACKNGCIHQRPITWVEIKGDYVLDSFGAFCGVRNSQIKPK